MKQFFRIGFFVVTIGFLAFGSRINAQVTPAQAGEIKNPASASKKSFVLLELYTSEGCPTCPPADANLARLEKEQPIADTEIVTLALHVDYWNSLSWKDVYSSPLFSRRQQIYSQALKINQSYTPQMVVDGQTQLIGNNMAKAQKEILEAAKINKATIEIAAAADEFKIKISNLPVHENATVFLAITEDNLVSNRRSGANPVHTSVVRHLSSVGMLTAAQSNMELETIPQLQPNWKKENLKLIVFVQENASRKVLGVNRKHLLDR